MEAEYTGQLVAPVFFRLLNSSDSTNSIIAKSRSNIMDKRVLKRFVRTVSGKIARLRLASGLLSVCLVVSVLSLSSCSTSTGAGTDRSQALPNEACSMDLYLT